MQNKKIPYTLDSIPINTNGQAIEADCADVTLINYGTSTLIVNNSIRIPPPAVGGFTFIAISSNEGEIDRTKYICHFSPGGVNDALIIRRNYK